MGVRRKLTSVLGESRAQILQLTDSGVPNALAQVCCLVSARLSNEIKEPVGEGSSARERKGCSCRSYLKPTRFSIHNFVVMSLFEF